MVDNDYKSQKKHVIGRHMIGVDENKREEKLRRKLEQCFKQEGHLLITNDLQCNICGHETKYKGWSVLPQTIGQYMCAPTPFFKIKIRRFTRILKFLFFREIGGGGETNVLPTNCTKRISKCTFN